MYVGGSLLEVDYGLDSKSDGFGSILENQGQNYREKAGKEDGQG